MHDAERTTNFDFYIRTSDINLNKVLVQMVGFCSYKKTKQTPYLLIKSCRTEYESAIKYHIKNQKDCTTMLRSPC